MKQRNYGFDPIVVPLFVTAIWAGLILVLLAGLVGGIWWIVSLLKQPGPLGIPVYAFIFIILLVIIIMRRQKKKGPILF